MRCYMHLFWPQTYEPDVSICEDVPEFLGAHEGHVQSVSTHRHQVSALRAYLPLKVALYGSSNWKILVFKDGTYQR